ncbi:MAG: hypothetical protein ACK5NA_00950 [Enterococcus sp.]
MKKQKRNWSFGEILIDDTDLSEQERKEAIKNFDRNLYSGMLLLLIVDIILGFICYKLSTNFNPLVEIINHLKQLNY